jgi:hypothetical protein
MPDYRRKLQDLLRELFQFDATDLDFGIYAIMNRKRDQIERFIEHELLDVIRDGLQLQSAAQRTAAEADFAAAEQKLIEAAGNAVEGDQVKPEYRQLPLCGVPAIKHAVDEYDTAKAARDEASLSCPARCWRRWRPCPTTSPATCWTSKPRAVPACSTRRSSSGRSTTSLTSPGTA